MLRSNGASPHMIEKLIECSWTLLFRSKKQAKRISTIRDVLQSVHIEGASQSKGTKLSL